MCEHRFVNRLDRDKKTKLVTGYISNYALLDIPEDITNLCHVFYDDVIYWKCSQKYIKKCILSHNINTGAAIRGPSFIGEKDIEYEFIIYPKGSQPLYNGYCEIFFRVKNTNFENEIEKLILYFELGCIETNTEYRNIGQFSIDDTWSNWYPFNMKSAELQGLYKNNFLTFNIYIDIIQIKYKSNCLKLDYYKNIKIYKKSGYKWIVKGKLLKNFIFYPDNKRFYSSNYFQDNCWCLYATPNTKHANSYFQIYLRLIRLPKDIKTIKIECYFQININSKNENNSFIKQFNYDDNSLLLATLKPSQLLDAKKLIFNVNVNILKVYDYNDKLVAKKCWNNYGIYNEKKNQYAKYHEISWKKRTKLRIKRKFSAQKSI